MLEQLANGSCRCSPFLELLSVMTFFILIRIRVFCLLQTFAPHEGFVNGDRWSLLGRGRATNVCAASVLKHPLTNPCYCNRGVVPRQEQLPRLGVGSWIRKRPQIAPEEAQVGY